MRRVAGLALLLLCLTCASASSLASNWTGDCGEDASTLGDVPAEYRCECAREVEESYIPFATFHYCTMEHYPFLSLPVLIFALLFLFYALAGTADRYLIPALNKFSDFLHLSPNVAGVTLLAFGNGAPDVFTTMAAFTVSDGSIGLGLVLGGGVYVTTTVLAAVILVGGEFKSYRRPFIRDVLSYALSIVFLLAVYSTGEATMGHSLVFVIWYVAFVLVVVLGRIINQRLKRKRRAQQSLEAPLMDEAAASDQPSAASYGPLRGEPEARHGKGGDDSDDDDRLAPKVPYARLTLGVNENPLAVEQRRRARRERRRRRRMQLAGKSAPDGGVLSSTAGQRPEDLSDREDDEEDLMADFQAEKQALGRTLRATFAPHSFLADLGLGRMRERLRGDSALARPAVPLAPMQVPHTISVTSGYLPQQQQQQAQPLPHPASLRPAHTLAGDAKQQPQQQQPPQRYAAPVATAPSTSSILPFDPSAPVPAKAAATAVVDIQRAVAEEAGADSDEEGLPRPGSSLTVALQERKAMQQLMEEKQQQQGGEQEEQGVEEGLAGLPSDLAGKREEQEVSLELDAGYGQQQQEEEEEQRRPVPPPDALARLRAVGDSTVSLSEVADAQPGGLLPQKPAATGWRRALVFLKGLISLLVYIMEAPLTIMRELTVASLGDDDEVHGEPVNTSLVALTLAFAPIVFCFVVDASLPAYIGMAFVGCTAALFMINKLPTFPIDNGVLRPPRNYELVFLLEAFIMSCVWIFLVADELVSALTVIGSVLGLSKGILGLTVLAWGNSIGDFVANLSLARSGNLKMAAAGCLGAPAFNALVGVGMGLTVRTVKDYPTPFHFGASTIVPISLLFLILSLTVTLIFVVANGFTFTRKQAYVLLGIYAVFLVCGILSESGVIPAIPIGPRV